MRFHRQRLLANVCKARADVESTRPLDRGRTTWLALTGDVGADTCRSGRRYTVRPSPSFLPQQIRSQETKPHLAWEPEWGQHHVSPAGHREGAGGPLGFGSPRLTRHCSTMEPVWLIVSARQSRSFHSRKRGLRIYIRSFRNTSQVPTMYQHHVGFRGNKREQNSFPFCHGAYILVENLNTNDSKGK